MLHTTTDYSMWLGNEPRVAFDLIRDPKLGMNGIVMALFQAMTDAGRSTGKHNDMCDIGYTAHIAEAGIYSLSNSGWFAEEYGMSYPNNSAFLALDDSLFETLR